MVGDSVGPPIRRPRRSGLPRWIHRLDLGRRRVGEARPGSRREKALTKTRERSQIDDQMKAINGVRRRHAPPGVRGHEKVPTGGQVAVPAGGQ